jgi:hypothetical protein
MEKVKQDQITMKTVMKILRIKKTVLSLVTPENKKVDAHCPSCFSSESGMKIPPSRGLSIWIGVSRKHQVLEGLASGPDLEDC